MIEAVDLTRRFGTTVAVDGVCFSVARGELLVLVGGSGSGKTTTLKMINRLIEPTSGRVTIDGEDVRRGPGHLLRQRVGYVFQKVGLFPHMTVGENVAVTLSLLGVERHARQRRAQELLELVELDPALADRPPSELSGGQQQRVGVARALAARPKIMLLDEPFGALDPLTRDRLQRSFQRIRRELAVTAVFVTHDMAEALLLADRIAVMRAGRLIQCGAPADLLAAPADAYVSELLEAPRRQARAFDALASRRDDRG
jgi:osmoprotectant transport system ATP-binding protein